MENGNSSEPAQRAMLRFNGSESLAHVVEKTFIAPQFHHQFAVRALHLYLVTEHPVDIDTHADGALALLDGHDPLERYNAGIAQPHKGEDLYRHHYPLLSDTIRGVEYQGRSRGVSLLFQLALSDYERHQLLASPFNDVRNGAAYVATQVHEQWLVKGKALDEGMHELSGALGASHPTIRHRGYLLDSYYVTKPTAIIIPSSYPPSQAK